MRRRPGARVRLRAVVRPARVRDSRPPAALSRCLCCGLDRLYVQKDFSKKAGLWVFIVAAALSVPTWGLEPAGATLIDLGLYYALGDATLCYGWRRGAPGLPHQPRARPFDIHTQETVDHRARHGLRGAWRTSAAIGKWFCSSFIVPLSLVAVLVTVFFGLQVLRSRHPDPRTALGDLKGRKRFLLPWVGDPKRWQSGYDLSLLLRSGGRAGDLVPTWRPPSVRPARRAT